MVGARDDRNDRDSTQNYGTSFNHLITHLSRSFSASIIIRHIIECQCNRTAWKHCAIFRFNRAQLESISGECIWSTPEADQDATLRKSIPVTDFAFVISRRFVGRSMRKGLIPKRSLILPYKCSSENRHIEWSRQEGRQKWWQKQRPGDLPSSLQYRKEMMKWVSMSDVTKSAQLGFGILLPRTRAVSFPPSLPLSLSLSFNQHDEISSSISGHQSSQAITASRSSRYHGRYQSGSTHGERPPGRHGLACLAYNHDDIRLRHSGFRSCKRGNARRHHRSFTTTCSTG